jgi:hypothetical protein
MIQKLSQQAIKSAKIFYLRLLSQILLSNILISSKLEIKLNPTSKPNFFLEFICSMLRNFIKYFDSYNNII